MIQQTIHVFSIVQPKPGTARDQRRFRVKWRVDGRDFSKQFRTKAEAERLRSQLQVAVTEGSRFDQSTGLPEKWRRSSATWWTWSSEWLALKWPTWSGNSRRSGVESLVAITPHLARRGAPPFPENLPRWLREVGFRPDVGQPEEQSPELLWLRRWSVPIDAMDPSILQPALIAATTRRDGGPMSADVVRRRRNAIKSVLTAAVRRRTIDANPFDRIELRLPQREIAVDISTVPSLRDLDVLVCRVAALRTDGARYAYFFASLGLAGFRPSEAAALLVNDLTLPVSGWGLARLRGAITSPGLRYTATGESREAKGLKHRALASVREVPIPPLLVDHLRRHLDRWAPIDGRVFSNGDGRPVTTNNYGKVWRRERDLLWPSGHPCQACPTYDLRHTAATMMLRAGVPPTEVARRLGHSVDVLMRVYAGVFDDERLRSNALIDQELSAMGRLPKTIDADH